jgi:hypothetical protein
MGKFEIGEEVFEIIERDSIYGFATRLVVTLIKAPFPVHTGERDKMRFWIGWKRDLADNDIVGGWMVKVAEVLVRDVAEDRERCSQAFWNRWCDMIHMIEWDWTELEEEPNRMAEDRERFGDVDDS